MHPQPSSKPDIPLIASDCWLYSTIPQWNPIVLLLVNPWTKVNQQKRGVQAAQLKIIPSITWTYPMYKWTIVVVPITRYCLNFGQDVRWVNNLILEQLLVTIQIPEGVSVKWLRGLVVPFREAIWIDFSILCIYIYIPWTSDDSFSTPFLSWLIFIPGWLILPPRWPYHSVLCWRPLIWWFQPRYVVNLFNLT